MKYLKILLSLILVLLLCVSAAACKKDNKDPEVSTDSQSEEQSESDTNNNVDDIPDMPDPDLGIPATVGGISYKSLYDAYDNTNMIYWEGVAEADAKAYGNSLLESGYSLSVTNDDSSVYSATYKKDSSVVHVYYLKKLSEFRALVSQGAAIPPAPYAGEKICDVMVTQVGVDTLSPSEGMSYIIRLEDGSFVIIDGGFDKNGDADKLYSALSNLNSRSGAKEITVRAWFLTHSDKEHYGALSRFIENYESKVKIDLIVANDPADTVYTGVGATSGGLSYSTLDGLFGGCKYVKAHTGYKFEFAGVTMNILYTHEDANQMKTNSIDSRAAMVIDAHIGSTRLLWLGDLETDGATRLKSMYGDALDCDILQISSGENNGSEELYRLCSPNTVFWAGSKQAVDAVKNSAKNSYLSETAQSIYYAYNGNKTVKFGESDGDTPSSGGSSGNVSNGGSVDEDGNYSKDY